jgi:hypothetical protein
VIVNLRPLAALLSMVLAGSILWPPLAAGSASLPPLPAGWPSTFEIGMSDGPGDAAGIRATAPFAFRSQYLAGGVNTGTGWSTWNPDGAFVTYYIQDSVDHGVTPVFDYYMLLQSSPATGADEGAKDYSNLNNAGTMSAYYADLKLFFQRAGAFSTRRVILHVEPDLWGYLQQRSSRDDATTLSAKVSGSGVADLAGLPDTASGFAQAVVRLRDRYAPNVLVAYHLSVWGTGNDILYSKPTDATVDALANRAAAFYRSLAAGFDIAFAEASDRDAAFKQYVYGDNGASWWGPGDYARNVRFLAGFVAGAAKRVLLWQMPLGNTRMRAMNNTWGHYQDNHVEWFLDDPGRTHLSDYANAGVVGAIFGGGAAGTTCACDATGDGVTNPPPIGGNTLSSLSADDDGGFFRAQAAGYYVAGPLALPGSGTPSPTPLPSASPQPTPPAPSATPTPTPPPTPTPTPPATATPTPTPPGSCMASVGPGIPPPASVPAGVAGLHAAWYGQSGYPTLCAGQRSTATVAFYNSGSIGWVSGRLGEVTYLGTWGPEPGQDRPSPLGGDGQFGSPNTGWPRYNRIAIQPADYVGPGQVAWFQFTIQAPATPGTYRLYLRPVVEGASWLEDYGVFWVIAVR